MADYAHLKQFAANVPQLGSRAQTFIAPETREWIAKLHAILDDRRFGTAAIEISVSSDGLVGALHDRNGEAIMNALYRAIAKVELSLPASTDRRIDGSRRSRGGEARNKLGRLPKSNASLVATQIAEVASILSAIPAQTRHIALGS